MSEPSESLPSLALQQWTQAQKALDHAMQQYLASTMALCSSLESSTHSVKVDSLYSTMAKAQPYLNRIHNSVLLVNKLPSEIFLGIFTIAAFTTFRAQYRAPIPNSYQEDDHRELLALAHVCSRWRSILLNTPSFWSYFRLEPQYSLEAECERAEEYLSRARGVHQSLCLYDLPDRRYLYPRHSDLMHKFIEPRLNQLTQLSLLNFQTIQQVVQIIKLLLNNGKAGVLRTLAIQMHRHFYHLAPIYTGDAALAERAASILGPVRTLSLHGTRFAWDSPVYHNLLVLHIGGLPDLATPTIGEMLGILSSCPLLHTLRLYDMVIRPGHLATEPESVYLTELQYLDLELPPDSIGLLLPRVFPQNKDLSLRISCLDWGGQDCAVIYPFLARTNVTRFFIDQFDKLGSSSVLSQCLSVLPHLHTLVLDLSLKRGDLVVSDLIYCDASNTRYLPRCPQLHTVYFVTGSVSISAVQQVVEVHPLIRKLRFMGCYVEPFEDMLRDMLRPFADDIKFDPRPDTAMHFDWYHLMT